MSERVRESIIASLLASKRFVVAVCAAIAMVLGAMSAGASVFTDSTILADSPGGGIVFSEVPKTSGGLPVGRETPLFMSRPKLTSGQVVADPPLYTANENTAKKVLNLKLNQDVVKTTSAALFYDPLPANIDGDQDAGASALPPSSQTTSEPQASSVDPAGPAEPTPDPDVSTEPAPRGDPTTEPGLNNVAPITYEEQP